MSQVRVREEATVPRIALDVEGVLADIHIEILERYNQENETSIQTSDMDSWSWPNDLMGIDRFNEDTARIWNEEPETFEPAEVGLSKTVESLSDIGEVDIVTGRVGCDDAIKAWLEEHGITEYRQFISVEPGVSKAELDYDVYVDDKPGLADQLSKEQTQYMISKPYNESHWNHDQVEKVSTVSEALRMLEELDES